MEIKEDWEIKLIEEARIIAEHGFGELRFIVSESRETKTKLVVWAGRSWVFFKKRIIDFGKKKNIF